MNKITSVCLKAFVVVGTICGSVFCSFAKPSGERGFLKATFVGLPYDGTSDIWKKATEIEAYPSDIYGRLKRELITIGYATYMKMERGNTYCFKGCYDDFFTVKVDSKVIIPFVNKSSQELSGSFTPSSTGWYKVELRVANQCKGGGGCGRGGIPPNALFGILWKKDTDAEWRRFNANVDDIFYTEKPRSDVLSREVNAAERNERIKKETLVLSKEEEMVENSQAGLAEALFVKPLLLPDAAQIEKAVKIVQELCEDDSQALRVGKINGVKFAQKLMTYSSHTEDAAVKFVLLRNAFRQLLVAGYIKEAQTLFDIAFLNYGGRFAAEMANYSSPTLRKLSNSPKFSKSVKPLLALVEESMSSVKAIAEAKVNIGKRPADMRAKLKLAQNAVKLMDWELALKTYAGSEDNRGAICGWEIAKADSWSKDYTFEQVGDFWWESIDGKDEQGLLFRSVAYHATFWYRKALAEETMTELKTAIVKKRLAKVCGLWAGMR